jgi:hypothetical protein
VIEVYLAVRLISFFENLRFSNANAYTNNSLDFHVARKMQQGLKIYQVKRGEILSHSSFRILLLKLNGFGDSRLTPS